MGTFALRISVGIAALILASGASAQTDPKRMYMQQQMVPGRLAKMLHNYTVVPLHDFGGNVVLYISYADGTDGMRVVRFDDGTGRPINAIRVVSPAPTPSAGGGQNPLFGESFPPLPDTSVVDVPRLPSGRGGGLDSGKSDTGSELLHLVRRVNDLTSQVQMLTTKLDAATRKR